ncbi:hypothetical protein NDU88_006617 [Pleurodeles waltl]|uniref:Uncharacterized protein n=1 Tax=Pleurodeles waltl TaxID=8319 RepID=A0AAV7LR00_PLEWA|nr:hypothetical protein NDU88_006617 [Pleurodeles waltl]
MSIIKMSKAVVRLGPFGSHITDRGGRTAERGVRVRPQITEPGARTTSNAVTAAPVRVGGALCPYVAARERCSSQPPAPPNAPRAPPAQLRVPDARGGSRAKAQRGQLTRRGRQHCRLPLLPGFQGDPGSARRVGESGSGPGKWNGRHPP